MANPLHLKVVLEALDKATGPINDIVRSSKSLQRALVADAEAFKKLKTAQADISAYRRQSSALADTGEKLRATQEQLHKLAEAYAAAEKPTRKMAGELHKLGNTTRQLTARQHAQRQELAAAETKLRQAGVETSRLAMHEQQLASAISKANDKLKVQKQRLLQVGEAAERARRMHSGGMVAAAHGAGLAYGGVRALQGVGAAMQPGLELEARMRDIGITGGLSRSQEAALAAQVRADALKFGQTTDLISQGLGTLVANGITAQQDLARYSGLLAKSSVASGAEVADLSNLIVSLQQNLGLSSAQISGALDSLAYAGKQGSFELRDMAKWMPQLAPMMAALGVTGRDAVDQLGAALQVAKLGAGNPDEAANNLKNYLSKVVSPETISNFEKVGINLKQRLLELQSQGVNPLQGSLQLITEYMGQKGPEAVAKLQAALAIKDAEQQRAALEQLSSAYALGELFRDQQALGFVRMALLHGDKMKGIQQGAARSGGALNSDYRNRDDTTGRGIDRLKIALSELKQQAFDILKANIGEWAHALADGVQRFSLFAKDNPALVGAMVKLGVVLSVVAVALGGLLVVGGTASMMLGNILNVATKLGGGALVGSIGSLAAPLLLIALAGLVIWKYWQPIKAFLGGVWDGFAAGLKYLEPALGLLRETLNELFAPLNASKDTLDGFAAVGAFVGAVFSGVATVLALAVVGILKVFQWVGTAIGNFIGFIVTAVGNVWDIIKGVFTGDPTAILAGFLALWENINQFFGGIPAKLMQFGINMVQGLANGILSMFGAPGEALAKIADGAISKIKNLLGIHSPSRVFASLGGFTMAGFTQGLLGGERGAQAALGRIGGRLAKAGAGIAIGSTLAVGAASAANIDHRPPLAGGIRGGSSMAATYNITIHAGSAQNAQDIAALVRAEIERIEHQRRMRTRSELSDYE